MAPLVIAHPRELVQFIGKELGLSGWHQVTQQRIQEFAEATGDHQWIHLDAERAKKESPYGATIAHGFLTLSMISSLMKEAVDVRGVKMAVNYGVNRVRFPAPVRVNSEIRGRVLLLAVKELDFGIEATFSVTVEIKDQVKPCCAAECVLRYLF